MTDEELAKLIAETAPAAGAAMSEEPARAAEAPAPAPTPRPADPGLGRAFLASFGQGGLKGASDELAGLLGSALVGEGTGTPGTQYKKFRESERETLRAAQEYYPGMSLFADVLGDVGTDYIAKLAGVPVGSQAYQTGVGALSGLMRGETELTKPETSLEDIAGAGGSMVLGGGLSALGGAAGRALAPRLRGLREAIARRTGRGVAEATEQATAMAKQIINANVASLRGEAGGAASRAGNVLANIGEIDLPANAPTRTVGALKQSLEGQIEALTEDAAEARAKAIAAGVDPDELGVGRLGEYLSKGSKLDKAQQAARKVASYEAALARVRNELGALAGRADDEILPDVAGGLREAQSAMKTDPRFLDLKSNVLRNALSDFPRVADEAMAKRLVLQQAVEASPEALARLTAELLSPKAALERGGQLALRYGLPVVGGYLGSTIGGPEGAAIGAAAGAGARPGLQALYRTATKYPSVRNLGWQAAGAVGRALVPETLERVAPSVGRAVGTQAERTLDTGKTKDVRVRPLLMPELFQPPQAERQRAEAEALRKGGKKKKGKR